MNSTFKFKFKFAGCRLEKEILSTASCKLETTIVCRNLHPEAPSRARCSSSSSAGLAEAMRGGFRGCPSNKSRSSRSNLAPQAAARPATPSAIVAGDARRHGERGQRAHESLSSLDFSRALEGPAWCEATRKRGTGQRCRGARQLLSLGLHAE